MQSADTEGLAEPVSTTTGWPVWIWWLLGGLAAAAVTSVAFMLVAGKRRRRWRDGLAAATAEVSWFGRDLIPRLQQQNSLDGARGGWQVARARVGAVEDVLTALPTNAPQSSDAERASTLRDAVRAARTRLDAVLLEPEAFAVSTAFERARHELAAAATALESVLDADVDPRPDGGR